MVYQVTYHHTNAISQVFKTDRPHIVWHFPDKHFERWVNKVTKTKDPNKTYRTIRCTANFTSAELNAFYVYVMPNVKPTYSATYPKVEVLLDGGVTWTIYCAITHFETEPAGDALWRVTIVFTERSNTV